MWPILLLTSPPQGTTRDALEDQVHFHEFNALMGLAPRIEQVDAPSILVAT